MLQKKLKEQKSVAEFLYHLWSGFGTLGFLSALQLFTPRYEVFPCVGSCQHCCANKSIRSRADRKFTLYSLCAFEDQSCCKWIQGVKRPRGTAVATGPVWFKIWVHILYKTPAFFHLFSLLFTDGNVSIRFWNGSSFLLDMLKTVAGGSTSTKAVPRSAISVSFAFVAHILLQWFSFINSMIKRNGFQCPIATYHL